jgi:hypothetical protein
MRRFKNILSEQSPSTNFWNIFFLLLMICCCFNLTILGIVATITFIWATAKPEDLSKNWFLLFSPIIIIFCIMIVVGENIKIFNKFLDNKFGGK